MSNQYRTRPGDIVATESVFDEQQRILTVTQATMGQHSPDIPLLWGLFGERARRGGRLFVDQVADPFRALQMDSILTDPMENHQQSTVPNPFMSTAHASTGTSNSIK